MSYQTSWLSVYYPIVIMVMVSSVFIIFLALSYHDSLIDDEEFDFMIHQNDSCNELFQALEYENRKIFKDQPEVKVLTNFIMEKNC